jgi:hypothetical protein
MVRAETLAPLKLKGKAEPLDAWRLLEVLPDVPAFTRRLDVPFVGRSRELEVLRGAFERAYAEDSCELVTIVGAPGIGKSRLAREFRAETGDRARVVIGRCLPYGEGITYWPLMEVVRQIAGTDTRAGLDELLTGEDEGLLAVERLAAALGLVETPTPSEEIFWAVRVLFEKLARERPLIAVVDDIHWAEPTLLDMLEYLVGFATGPIFLICNARPDLFDSRPDWSRPRPSATTLVLEPLAENDSKTLVDQLLAGRPRAEALCRRIVETAEGNPLSSSKCSRSRARAKTRLRFLRPSRRSSRNASTASRLASAPSPKRRRWRVGSSTGAPSRRYSPMPSATFSRARSSRSCARSSLDLTVPSFPETTALASRTC